jgi:hypothetical protein
MFMDESRFENENEKYTCVIGLIASAGKTVKISKKADQIVKKYIGTKYSLLDGPINLKLLRQTKHKKSPFSKLKEKQRFKLTREIYNMLKSTECTLVCSIVQERENYSEAMKKGIYLISERFFYFLNENHSSGMVISDQPVSETHDYMEELVKLVGSQISRKNLSEHIFHTGRMGSTDSNLRPSRLLP